MPRVAKKVSTYLVRAYAPCKASNTGVTGSTVAACAPAMPLSAFTFGPHGSGTATVAIGGPAAGGFLGFRIDLRDVRAPDGKPVQGEGFTLSYTYQISTDLCAGAGDCTTVELTGTYPFAPCSRGRCSVSFGDTFQTGAILMAPFRSNIEIRELKVLDPDGNVFAVQGIGHSHGRP